LVNLSGAEFALSPGTGSGNYFSGAVRTNVVTFTISIDDYYYYYYYDSFDLVERLGPTTYLTVGGTATATAAPRNITGNLNGRFTLWEAGTSFYGSKRNVASCNAPDHRFSFIR